MKKTNFRSGFTLIELMVAMGLFVIVIGIVSATFIRSLRTQRQVVALMAANDNASFTLEQMAREIRTGSAFSSGEGRLSFENSDGKPVEYALVGRVVTRNGRPLTASNVLVAYLSFFLRGSEVGDGLSTRVTIRMGVSARGTLESSVTRLQTTIASRVLDG